MDGLMEMYTYLEPTLTNATFTGFELLTACLVSFGTALLIFFVVSSTAETVAKTNHDVRSTANIPVAHAVNGSTDEGSEEEGSEGEEEEDEESDDDDEDEATTLLAKPLSKTSPKGEEWKMVLLVRTDLKMEKGKAAAQCCHATLAAYRKMEERDGKGLDIWERHGQAKITLKCPDEETM
ncbi:hypothetical protein HDU98_006328 [Podochytrium sp. JEL0797]|nr:hypothetical protein HDU98_006328 [Podochytrium sp. JEL0797]